MRASLLFATCFLLIACCADATRGGETPLVLTLPGERSVTLRFHETTGNLSAVIYRDRELTLSGGGERQSFDIRVDEDWIYGKSRDTLRVIGRERLSEEAVQISVALGDWEIDFTYRLEGVPQDAPGKDATPNPGGPTIVRSARLKYKGDTAVRVHAFWCDYPLFRFEDEARFFSPTAYPPGDIDVAALPLNVSRHFGDSMSPLVLQLSPKCSLFFLNDDLNPNADRGGVSVEKRIASGTDGVPGLRISQSFNIQALMAPGSSQQLGEAVCRIVDGDGETALRNIHDWMAGHGHVVPPDIPDGFPGAVLYSFHPGGTIGSGMSDLGGFRAALPLLDRIADLGATGIWIMPIEDESLYSPRDYYKFQPGLGTPDDYRALVDRAHELGLGVLQDNVPHGGRNSYPRALEHPEWLLYDEEGKTLDYWCYDFNWPSWQEYIGQVVDFYLREYDIDGYRVDACGGSKIPNWNPDIPYARASHSQSQGGLGMLRTIREKTRSHKPRTGAVLAEVQGSVYGTVSDAVYDFTGCYNVFHDLRRRSPEEFVGNLRLWLHRQQYAELKGLLRLRHVESHDALRAQLWYGTRAHRSLMALTAWIHGIPLVYHNEEVGHTEVFRHIFAIRKQLPELRGGDADYLAVEAPPGVFACLRSTDETASVALIDFRNNTENAGTFQVSVPLSSLPPKLRNQIGKDAGKLVATDTWTDKPVKFAVKDTVKSAVKDDVLTLDVRNLQVNECGGTVIALGTQARTVACEPLPVKTSEDRKTQPSGTPDIPMPDDALVLEGLQNRKKYRLTVNRDTGLPARIEVDGRTVFGAADLLLPEGFAEKAGKVEYSRETMGQTDLVLHRFRLPFGETALELHYDSKAKSINSPLIVRAKWVGEKPEDLPRNAAIFLPVVEGDSWFAETVGGRLWDSFTPRHTGQEGRDGHIYWRRQGTGILFDSLVTPMPTNGTTVGVLDGNRTLSIRVSGRESSTPARKRNPCPPARLRWVERLGGSRGHDKEPGLLVSWFDEEFPRSGTEDLTLDVFPPKPKKSESALSFSSHLRSSTLPDPGPILHSAPGGWDITAGGYRARLSRSGVLTRLWTKYVDGKERIVVDGGDIYTDYGYGRDKLRYAASNEVEAASRFLRVGDKLYALFHGRLRGFGRFERLNPPIEYRLLYVFGERFGFRVEGELLNAAPARDGRAFLALFLPLPEASEARYLVDGKEYPSGNLAETPGRSWQSRAAVPGQVPEAIRVLSPESVLVDLLDIRSADTMPLANVFMQSRNLFLAFDDDTAAATCPSKRSFRFDVNVGGRGDDLKTALAANRVLSKALEAGSLSLFEEAVDETGADERATTLLLDGGFERGHNRQVVALHRGTALALETATAAWRLPPGGRIVHGGANDVFQGRAAFVVEGKENHYLMAGQQLPGGVKTFPPGSRWRLTAWVRGENLAAGDVGWKVGTLRFCLDMPGGRQYRTCPALTGTFDWKQVAVEVEIPESLEGLSVEIGNNGGTGTLWADGIELRRLDEP